MTILNRLKSKKDKTQTRKADSSDQARGKQGPAVVAEGGQTAIPRHSALLIRQPWVTEKAGDLSALGKYVFIADKKTNKAEAKRAIESIYGVNVEKVNVVNIKGKAKRLGRSLGRTSAHKKIIVTLKEGQKIDIMPT